MEAFARAVSRKECSLLLKIVPMVVSSELDNACLHLLEDQEFLGHQLKHCKWLDHHTSR